MVEFVYLIFTHMPGRVTVDDSGLCYCILCLLIDVTYKTLATETYRAGYVEA